MIIDRSLDKTSVDSVPRPTTDLAVSTSETPWHVVQVRLFNIHRPTVEWIIIVFLSIVFTIRRAASCQTRSMSVRVSLCSLFEESTAGLEHTGDIGDVEKGLETLTFPSVVYHLTSCVVIIHPPGVCSPAGWSYPAFLNGEFSPKMIIGEFRHLMND